MLRMLRRWVRTPALRLALVLWVCPVPATAQIAGGTIAGVVADPSGAAIAGVRVTATHLGTNRPATTVTNAQGYYEFPLLPAGRYRLEAVAQAFQGSEGEAFVLHAGTRQRHDIVLSLGPVAATVDVSAAPALVNATTTSLGVVIDERQVDALPLNGRNFQQLAGLQAGVVNAPASATGARGGIEFNGSPALGNNLLLDGVDMSFGEHSGAASDTSAGAAGGALINTISVEAIAEVKTSGSAVPAEYGRAAGGVLNVTTRSGTNQWRGTAFEFFRHDALDARSLMTRRAGLPKPPLRWHQFGGNLGGPIRRDGVFVFGNYEGARVRRSQAVAGSVPTPLLLAAAPPAIREVLRAFPAAFDPTGDPLLGFHQRDDERRNDEHTSMIRVDAHRGSHRVAARYNYNHQDVTQPTMAPAHPRLFPMRLHNAAVQHGWVLSPSLFNEARAGVNRSDLDRHHVGTHVVPAWVAAGPLAGLALPSDIHFMTTTYSVADNLTHIRGRHSIKAGFEIRKVDSRRVQTGLPTHRYDTVADLIADRPNHVQVIFGNPGVPLRTVNYGVYVQDDWRVSPRIQLNAGLRYEYSPPLRGAFNVTGSDPFGPFNRRGDPMFAPDRDNVGPRLGVVFDVLGHQRLVVRAGGAVLHAPPQPFFYFDMAFIDPTVPFLATFTEQDVPAGVSLHFPFPQAFVAAVAADPARLPAGFHLSRSLADFHREDESSIQWNGTVQYALGARASVQASYVASRASHLYSTRPINLVDPATGQRPRPGFGEIVYRENAGRSKYDALHVSLQQRPWRGLSLDGHYTLARSWGYYGPDASLTTDATVQDVHDIAGSAGPKSSDVRHRLVGTHAYELPAPAGGALARSLLGGWTLQGITTWRSGLPINVTAGIDLAGNRRVTGQRPDPVPGVDPYVRDARGLRWLNPAAFDVLTPLAERRFGRLGFNALRGPSAFTYDLAVHRRFGSVSGRRVVVRLEAFNVFDHPVLGTPVANLASSTFGQITSAGDGRTLQIGVKYLF